MLHKHATCCTCNLLHVQQVACLDGVLGRNTFKTPKTFFYEKLKDLTLCEIANPLLKSRYNWGGRLCFMCANNGFSFSCKNFDVSGPRYKQARREPQGGPGNHYRGALSQLHSVCAEIETPKASGGRKRGEGCLLMYRPTRGLGVS